MQNGTISETVFSFRFTIEINYDRVIRSLQVALAELDVFQTRDACNKSVH